MTPLRRLTALAALAAFLLPGAAALGVGLHLALEHHHHTAAELGDHRHQLAELARSAAHGHHHPAEATPEHEHSALVDASALLLRPGAAATPLLASASSPATVEPASSPLDHRSRLGPAVALFTTHCSLLL